MFYRAVAAAVLLYGSESWVISAFDLRALEGFHMKAARRLTGMRPTKRGEIWVYPKSAEVLRAARLRTIGDYIARRRHRVADEGARAMQRTFTAYGEKLRRVDRFKYLGRMLSYDDSDTPAIRRNLQRARAAWGRLSAVIAKEEVPPPVAGMFYQAVVAAVLL